MDPYSLLNNLIFLDIETTGLDPKTDKIIEIGAVKIKNNVVSRFNTLVNPHRKVPLNILDLCSGITQESIDQAPEISEVMVNLLNFIEDLPLVCHNAGFEKNFLKIKNEFLDSLELIAILFPELTEFNLQYLIRKFLPSYRQEKHRGLSDSEDTIEVLNYAISSFYNHSGYALPMSIIDLESWGWYKYLTEVNMDEVKHFVDKKPFEFEEKVREPYPIFALKDYEKLLENKEIWLRNGRSYTLRPQQKEASKYIREALEKETITIMEAPTGIGKSMAYLLPSVIYTHLKKDEKVIISTNTKGLQNQLVEKDIPNLLECLNLKQAINYTLIKGKSNYLCYDRFEDIEFPKDMNTLLGYVYLKRLMTEKNQGDIEEINPILKEKFNLSFLLEQCYCDSELCDVEHCKYKERCYYSSKVKALEESQIIVVNHSLLLRWPYLNAAPLVNIMVDEAHNLTQEIYDAFESVLISHEFEKFLKDIYNSKEKSGYLFYLSRKAKKDTLPLVEIEKDIEQCINQLKNIQVAFQNYIITSGIDREYNIKDYLNKDNSEISVIINYLDYLKADLGSLNVKLDKAITTLEDISTIKNDKMLKILFEKVEYINAAMRLIEDILLQNKEGYCFYYEVDKNFQWWKISSIPLDVSGLFYDRILNGVKSCLFISATLSTDNGYSSFKNTLGINIAKSENKKIIEVPPLKPVFDYKGKSVIYALNNFDPNEAESFSKDLKEFVLDLVTRIEGNIIMLFTSRKRLTLFKKEAMDELNALGIRVVEGKRDVEKLKSREARYILLGSKGYFEGVDVPGDAMSTVILDKVPNINSKEPFYKSLIEKVISDDISLEYDETEKSKYWQAYKKINFPIVSIDMKQIYGRLIRTEFDYGSLFIMSKFNSGNALVKKLEKQLHGVPVIRKNSYDLFRDINFRLIRWKQMNLYTIMKEVKEALKESLLEKKQKREITTLQETEDFVNKFMSIEYTKRKLNYDVKISFSKEVSIYIAGKKIDLGISKGKINQYFRDCFK
ncbi:MAG: exonuclease domain-containing protein [Clostridiaceae bacterium]